MTSTPNTSLQPTAAANYVVQAARVAAQSRMEGAAQFLKLQVPADGVLYKLRLPSVAGQQRWLQFIWPGVLQLVDGQGTVLKETIAGWMERDMPYELSLLRKRKKVDAVLLTAVWRRPHRAPFRLTFDASGVLRVCHARTKDCYGYSEPGIPSVLSRNYTGLSFHDLLPRLQ